jgi:superfamily II DNA/RNA helicase
VPVVSELEAALQRSAALPSPEPTPFRELGLPERLVAALERADRTTAFEIQARVLPDALAGRNLLGRARTGSGKTIAFGLPVLTRLADTRVPRRAKAIRGLVLVPTRELAGQVVDTIEPLGRALGLRTLAVYGGASIGRQIDALRRGVDIVVATPGRLLDLLERDAATLSAVEITVLDEADHLADLGFLPAVTRLLDQTPPNTQRMLFSATLDREVDTLIRRYLPDLVAHAVADEAPSGQIDHHIVAVTTGDKIGTAAAIAAEPGRTLVFVRTKHGADRLAKQLSRAGVAAGAIHGILRQGQRERALAGFASGQVPVLVATDVAARGIHVDAVERVLHYDPAADAKTHLHRSGRTGRAGADGTVVTLVLPGPGAGGRGDAPCRGHPRHAHRGDAPGHDGRRGARPAFPAGPAVPADSAVPASASADATFPAPATGAAGVRATRGGLSSGPHVRGRGHLLDAVGQPLERHRPTEQVALGRIAAHRP